MFVALLPSTGLFLLVILFRAVGEQLAERGVICRVDAEQAIGSGRVQQVLPGRGPLADLCASCLEPLK